MRAKAHLSKAPGYLFWQLRQLCKMVSNDSLADWKALVILGGCEIVIVMTLVFVASISVGHRLWPTSGGGNYTATFGLASLLYGLNYFLLTYRNGWTRFQKQFEHYSVRMRVAGAIATVLFVILVAIGGAWSATAASHLPH